MFKLRLALFFFLVLSGLASKAFADPKHATVLVGLADGTTWSGVIVARDTVLTSSALLDVSQKTFIVHKDKIFEAKLESVKGSLATFKVRNLGGTKIAKLERSLRLNESLRAISAYHGSYKGRFHGASEVMLASSEESRIYTTIPCAKGAMGSPVYAGNRFVGVIIGTIGSHTMVAKP